MNTIDYFKLQAKNLHRDFKTKKPSSDNRNSVWLYEYSPKYFDVTAVICDFDLDQEKLNLMRAQHIIAKIAGFERWTVLLLASEPDLEIAKILYDNQDLIDLRMWEDYIAGCEAMKKFTFDSELRLDICKEVLLKDRIFDDCFTDYRLFERDPD